MKHLVIGAILVLSLVWIACKTQGGGGGGGTLPQRSYLEAFTDAEGDDEITFRLTNIGDNRLRVELIDNHIRVERDGKVYHARVTPAGATEHFIKDVIRIDPGQPIIKDG